MDWAIVIDMEDSASKKSKNLEIDLNKISTLKRVSDLFPMGVNSETMVGSLPKEVNRLVSNAPVVKNIPNLVNPTLNRIPQNSIADDIDKRNADLQKSTQNQIQTTLLKRIKPINIVTILLTLGWILTIILLNVL